MILEDNYRHKGLRKQLVETIRGKGITSEKVLDAINSIPRHVFLDPAFLERAYDDTAFQIGEGQTISQPFTVAYQTQLLEVKPREKILEIGTGSGYQACVLAKLGVRVYSIERQRNLYLKTNQLLAKLKIPNIKTFYGDGFEGLPSFAPFDKVLITAAVPEVPQKLLGQLKIGGFLVMPYGEGKVQVMQKFTRKSEKEYESEEFKEFKFVPMLKGKV